MCWLFDNAREYKPYDKFLAKIYIRENDRDVIFEIEIIQYSPSYEYVKIRHVNSGKIKWVNSKKNHYDFVERLINPCDEEVPF